MWGNAAPLYTRYFVCRAVHDDSVASNTMQCPSVNARRRRLFLRTLGFAPAYVVGMMIAASSVICLGADCLARLVRVISMRN